MILKITKEKWYEGVPNNEMFVLLKYLRNVIDMIFRRSKNIWYKGIPNNEISSLFKRDIQECYGGGNLACGILNYFSSHSEFI